MSSSRTSARGHAPFRPDYQALAPIKPGADHYAISGYGNQSVVAATGYAPVIHAASI
jgi:hypothetical protein